MKVRRRWYGGGVEEREIWIHLLKVGAALHRKRASEFELCAACLGTASALEGFATAFETAMAPFEAERAAAHFEGRVAPSLEVFAAEDG